jgi:hypothetical protein
MTKRDRYNFAMNEAMMAAEGVLRNTAGYQRSREAVARAMLKAGFAAAARLGMDSPPRTTYEGDEFAPPQTAIVPETEAARLRRRRRRRRRKALSTALSKAFAARPNGAAEED